MLLLSKFEFRANEEKKNDFYFKSFRINQKKKNDDDDFKLKEIRFKFISKIENNFCSLLILNLIARISIEKIKKNNKEEDRPLARIVTIHTCWSFFMSLPSTH